MKELDMPRTEIKLDAHIRLIDANAESLQMIKSLNYSSVQLILSSDLLMQKLTRACHLFELPSRLHHTLARFMDGNVHTNLSTDNYEAAMSLMQMVNGNRRRLGLSEYVASSDFTFPERYNDSWEDQAATSRSSDNWCYVKEDTELSDSDLNEDENEPVSPWVYYGSDSLDGETEAHEDED